MKKYSLVFLFITFICFVGFFILYHFIPANGLAVILELSLTAYISTLVLKKLFYFPYKTYQVFFVMLIFSWIFFVFYRYLFNLYAIWHFEQIYGKGSWSLYGTDILPGTE